MPRSSYYYYVKQIKKQDKYAVIKTEIESIYHEHQGRYGYRRITMELHNRGYQINHKTVQRLMRELDASSGYSEVFHLYHFPQFGK